MSIKYILFFGAIGNKNSLFVKLSGMSEKGEIRGEIKRLEKKRGKEDKKYPTMPHVIFNYYRVRKTGRKGQAFSANIDYIQQDGMPSCRHCGARDAIFYDHYERKAKLNSIDGKAYIERLPIIYQKEE